MKFNYRRRPPFLLLQRIAKYHLEDIDHFLELAGEARSTKERQLEKIVDSAEWPLPEDWLVDDFGQLHEFSNLAGEFAIVGLWRCIELYRKQSISIALGKGESEKVHINEVFKKKLSKLGFDKEKIRCAKSVNELCCLNNSIKHERRVGYKLSKCHRWKTKNGAELGNLMPHYRRLRPLAEDYLQDLTDRLCRWDKTVCFIPVPYNALFSILKRLNGTLKANKDRFTNAQDRIKSIDRVCKSLLQGQSVKTKDLKHIKGFCSDIRRRTKPGYEKKAIDIIDRYISNTKKEWLFSLSSG